MVDIFVDANIFLDVMRLRRGWQASARVLDRVHKAEVQGYISSLILTILFYELKKNLTRDRAMQELGNALKRFQLADLAKDDLANILADERVSDFEDRVQFRSAKRVSNIIVTRNKYDYRRVSKEIEVFTPEEFLERY